MKVYESKLRRDSPQKPIRELSNAFDQNSVFTTPSLPKQMLNSNQNIIFREISLFKKLVNLVEQLLIEGKI